MPDFDADDEIYEESGDELDPEDFVDPDSIELEDLEEFGLVPAAPEFTDSPSHVVAQILMELFGHSEPIPVINPETNKVRGSWPRRLSENTKKIIVEAVGVGANLSLAGYTAGVDGTTVRRWLEEGDSDLSEGLLTPAAVFYLEILVAQGQSQHRWLSRINEAADAGDWKAAAWQLAKRWPAIYGDKTELTHRDPDGAIAAPKRVEIYVSTGDGSDPDSDPVDEA